MKYALAVALTLLAATAQAASPEENYIAARDALHRQDSIRRAISLRRATPPPRRRSVRATELGKQMRSLIGPLNVKGFAGEGTYNVGSLFNGDMESGILDGLLFTRGKDVRLVVTTTGPGRSLDQVAGRPCGGGGRACRRTCAPR